MRRAALGYLAAAAVLLALVVVAIRFLPRASVHGVASAQASATPTPAGPMRAVVLFHADPDGSGLVARKGEVAPAQDAGTIASEILALELAPPAEDAQPAIAAMPAGVTLRALFFDGKGTAIVDLGGLPAALAGTGTEAQALAVWSVVDALAFNFPAEARRVRLLLDGHEAAAAGVIALDAPLAPRRDLVTGDVPAVATPVAGAESTDDTP